MEFHQLTPDLTGDVNENQLAEYSTPVQKVICRVALKAFAHHVVSVNITEDKWQVQSGGEWASNSTSIEEEVHDLNRNYYWTNVTCMKIPFRVC